MRKIIEFLKQILPIFIVKRATCFLRRTRCKQNNILLDLQKKERYKEGVSLLMKFPIQYTDAPSLASEYTTIFRNNIYQFQTESQTPYIIDCGANIGLSILYFKEMYPKADILAFEADRKVFKVLERNIKTANLSKVNLINKAVWNKETEIDFYSEGADAGRISILNNVNKIKTKTVKLSSFLTKRVDFLKMDIEGAEVEVIQEIEHKLSVVEKIYIEYHSFVKEEQNLHLILEILKNNNFRYYIQSIGISSYDKFINRKTYLDMDLQLHIYAYK